MSLRPDQIRRYARHLLLPELSGQAQERLLAATAQATDSTAIVYLAAAGVGTIAIPEGQVEAPDVLFELADVGRSRVEAARERVTALNPDVRIIAGPGSWRVMESIDALAEGAREAGRLIRELAR